MTPITSTEVAALLTRVRALLGAKYAEIEHHATGGMKVIFVGTNRKLARREAIKVLWMRREMAPEDLVRFQREWRTVAALRHPNVVAIHDADYNAGERLAWMAEDFIEGPSLGELLRSQALTGDRKLGIAIQVASALEYAHSKGIVHQDIKPENILVDARGRAFVTDFGIAAIAGQPRGAAGPVFGTPAFVSPEQAQGQPVDKPSDLYSFGLVLYEMFTGHRLFEGPNAEDVLRRQIHEPPRSPRSIRPDLPESLNTLLLMLIQKDPAKRPTAAETRRQLEAISRTIGGARRPLPAWPVLAGGLLVGVVLIGYILGRGGGPPPLTEGNQDGRGKDPPTTDSASVPGTRDTAVVLDDKDPKPRPERPDSTLFPSPAPKPPVQASVTTGTIHMRVVFPSQSGENPGRAQIMLDGSPTNRYVPFTLDRVCTLGVPITISLRCSGYEFDPPEIERRPSTPGETLEFRFQVARSP
ncbi:MAG: serine/threonine protein kinase [Candidatus Eisenbacteria bacterium]|nr:serine/threonine protein kinase [Candidatus Eisenbacteria bacterium]